MRLFKPLFITRLVTAAVVVVLAAAPMDSAAAQSKPQEKAQAKPQAKPQAKSHSFSGLCAYYSGRGGGLTAAHRTLPFGTRLRVIDPKTGRSVVVTINDRGPFGKHRILDLSVRAARALGMLDRGVIYVRAEVM